MTSRDFVVVTGFQEALSVLLNTRDFSSCNNPDALAPLPFEIEGDDLSAQIEASWDRNPMTLLVSYDGDRHSAARSLLHPLFTPSRLRANEQFMRSYADQMVLNVVAKGGCELISEVATPFVTMVIADLLGVPDDDREEFRRVIDSGPPPGNMDASLEEKPVHTLQYLGTFFARYVQERRASPRDDVLTELAQAKFPDGSTPDLMEVVKAAMFLFAAGQDTSAKLLGTSIRFLADDPELQQRMREDRTLIGPFLEEALRLEGSVKAMFRLAKRNTRIGDMEIPAGKTVVIAISAANRDESRWENPNRFELGRPKIKEHLAFGRGAHVCAGAPLARAEVAVILDRFLEHTSEISLSEEHHGPRGNRRLSYEPSYIIRGLAELHTRFTPRQ
jgi:cytochrome P450